MIDIREDLTVRFKLSFLITVFTAVTSIVVIFVSLRMDVMTMLRQVDAQQKLLEKYQTDLMEVKLRLQTIDANLSYLKDKSSK